MEIEFGNRYKTRNGQIVFVAVNDVKCREEAHYIGCNATKNLIDYECYICWLKNGKCTNHSRKAYYSNRGYNSMEEFLSQFDIVEEIDDNKKQLTLF